MLEPKDPKDPIDGTGAKEPTDQQKTQKEGTDKPAPEKK